MELKANNTYIFKYQKSSYRAPFKGKIEEITEITIQITNLDSNVTFRDHKETFNKEWKPIELVEDWEVILKKAVENMKEQPLQVIPDPEPNFVRLTPRPCGNQMCLCDGSCWRSPSLTGAVVYDPHKYDR